MACPHTEELPNLENPFFGIPGSSSLVFAWGNVVAPMILASLSWMERLSLQAFPRFITHNLHSCTRPQSNMEPEIVGIQVWNLFQQVHAFRLNLTLQGVLCVCVCVWIFLQTADVCLIEICKVSLPNQWILEDKTVRPFPSSNEPAHLWGGIHVKKMVLDFGILVWSLHILYLLIYLSLAARSCWASGSIQVTFWVHSIGLIRRGVLDIVFWITLIRHHYKHCFWQIERQENHC